MEEDTKKKCGKWARKILFADGSLVFLLHTMSWHFVEHAEARSGGH